MSSAATDIPAKPVEAQHPTEPFGQMGMRQYMIPVISWLCVIGIGICVAAWYRSLTNADRLEWRNADQELAISSVAGRIKIEGASYETRQFGNVGWGYRGSKFRNSRDGWQPSVFKVIGFEFGFAPERRGATGGFWIRIKWYFVAVVLSVIPLGREVLKWRRSRESHE